MSKPIYPTQALAIAPVGRTARSPKRVRLQAGESQAPIPRTSKLQPLSIRFQTGVIGPMASRVAI